MLLQRVLAGACAIVFVGAASATYTATLSPPPGSSSHVTGSAQVKGTSAEVMISDDQPSAERPWHVHKGSCGNDQGIFGSPSAYKPIKVGSDGKGNSKATLSMPLPDSGSYFVNVHSSMSDLKTIVTCGNLTKGM